MIIKLAIIGGIFLVGAILFMPQTMDLFPSTMAITDSIKQDISTIQNDTVNQVESGINDSIDSANDQIADITESSKDLLSVQGIPENIIPAQLKEMFFGKIKEAESP